MTNEELLDLLDERLASEGFRHPDDRANLFLSEVYDILSEIGVTFI